MTSVARKTHMPSVATSCCCARFANWCSSLCRSNTVFSLTPSDGSVELGLLVEVVIRSTQDDRSLGEIVRRGRRRRLPLQTGCTPGVRPGYGTVAERPDQVKQRQQIADGQDRSAGRRHHVPHLVF